VSRWQGEKNQKIAIWQATKRKRGRLRGKRWRNGGAVRVRKERGELYTRLGEKAGKELQNANGEGSNGSLRCHLDGKKEKEYIRELCNATKGRDDLIEGGREQRAISRAFVGKPTGR